MRGMQVNQPGADRAERGAGRETLQDTCREQHVEVSGKGEDQHHQHLGPERSQQQRAAAHVVRQRAEHQQRGQNRDGVHAEDHGHGEIREAPLAW